MKQFINRIIFTFALIGGVTACNNSEYSFDQLFPQEYHRIASIQDDPNGTLELYDIGEDGEMTFSVMRTGSDPSLSAEVGVETMTQEELETYNTKYVRVDPSMYTVSPTVSFATEERNKKVQLNFTTENIVRLKQMSESLEEGKTYYIAIKIKDIGKCTVYEPKNYILRKVIITKPKVQLTGSLESTEENPAWINAASKPEISLSLKLGTSNRWNFKCKVKYNPDLVDEYNSKHGTSFEKLPSNDDITIENNEVTFVAGEDRGQAMPKLKILNPALNGSGLYLIPIETETENFLGNTYYVVLENRITLSEKMLYAPFTVTYDGNWWQGLLDDNTNSYWHSPYKDPKYYDSEYGHWFQIKFDRPLNHGVRLKYWTRDYNPVLPIKIKICVSRDNGVSWTVLDQRDSGLCGTASSWLSPAYPISGSPITHLRFCVMKTNNGNCGVDSGACTAIAGFRIWGN